MSTDRLLQQGIQHFNEERYYEAHEVWEDLWRATEGPIRNFYQGLIQAAVGLHHLRRKNVTGARSQLAKSLKNLSAYPATCVGIDNQELKLQLGKILENLEVERILITTVTD